MGRKRWLAVCLTVLAVGAGTSCDDDDDEIVAGTVDYGYEYYYPYVYYYPSDLMYSSYYWSDAWLYDTYIYQIASTGPYARTAIGNVMRALARGEQVCVGQVAITYRTAPAACQAPGTTETRSGALITFNGCRTAEGGRIDGTVDIQATRTANEQVCSENTLITLSHTTTITNLSYTAADGSRVVVPSQMDTGTNTYRYGQLPGMVDINSNGQLQIFDPAGTLKTDLRTNGTRAFTYSQQDRSYTVSGTVTANDLATGAAASLVGNNVTRTMNCCHPTGGTLNVNRTGGMSPGMHTWSFGPECGRATFDGTQIDLPACM